MTYAASRGMEGVPFPSGHWMVPGTGVRKDVALPRAVGVQETVS